MFYFIVFNVQNLKFIYIYKYILVWLPVFFSYLSWSKAYI